MSVAFGAGQAVASDPEWEWNAFVTDPIKLLRANELGR